MKGIKIKLSLILALLVAGFYACQHEPIDVADANDAFNLKTGTVNNIVSEPVSDGGVTPYTIEGANPGGNRTCEEVATAFDTSFDLTIGQVNTDDEDFENAWPAGLTVEIYGDGNFVSFSMEKPLEIDGSCYIVGAVIVKGANNAVGTGADRSANIYYYEDGIIFDSGLSTPTSKNISNLTFCLIEVECEDECEWIGETAWSAGSRYTARGNWATYTAYAGIEKTVTLYAGQTMNAGSATFSAAVDGYVTITITLNAGWRFAEVEENVKIQDYASAPSGNPSPGLFDHKDNATESPFEIVVPENNFYGVHLDVEWEKCPE
jgi:hypothetical protein